MISVFCFSFCIYYSGTFLFFTPYFLCCLQENFLQQFVDDAYASSVKDRKNYVAYKHLGNFLSVFYLIRSIRHKIDCVLVYILPLKV